MLWGWVGSLGGGGCHSSHLTVTRVKICMHQIPVWFDLGLPSNTTSSFQVITPTSGPISGITPLSHDVDELMELNRFIS